MKHTNPDFFSERRPRNRAHLAAFEVETLRTRLGYLSGEEKCLVMMVIDKGLTFSHIARISRQNPSTIAKRFHRIRKLLLDGEYFYCLVNQNCFEAMEMKVIYEFFIQRKPLDRIACKHEITVYRVRKIIQKARLIRQLHKENKRCPEQFRSDSQSGRARV